MSPRAPSSDTLSHDHVDDYSVVDREALKWYYQDSFSHITCKPLIDDRDKHNRVTSHNKTTLFYSQWLIMYVRLHCMLVNLWL